MQARTLSPAAIFGYDIRYVIPLFQRPYVWNEQDQWAPLWADVRTVAESLLSAPPGYLEPDVSPHFLGAIVLDQPLARAGYLAARYVVDGPDGVGDSATRLRALVQTLRDHLKLVVIDLEPGDNAQVICCCGYCAGDADKHTDRTSRGRRRRMGRLPSDVGVFVGRI